MTDRSEPGDPGPRPSAARGVALVGVVFVATLVLLFGLLSFAGRAPVGDGSAGSAASFAAGTTVPSKGPSAEVGSASPSGGAPTESAVPTESAAPSSGGDPVLVGAGDIADCEGTADEATAVLVDGIPGTVFTAGDNAYQSGSAADFRDCYGPTWGRFMDRTRPAPGNHDHNTKELAGYLGYFGVAAAPSGMSWYSYDLGRWHVVVLDSSCGEVGGCGRDSAQGKWLGADLAASKATCTLAIWHHPRFSSGEHGNDVEVAPFWQALYAAGADVVINGHDHDYERFAPQDPGGHADAARGIREFVVGTGGADLRGFFLTARNSELRASVTHGVLRLVLHPASLEWTFIPTTGGFSDSGSGDCH